jgi:hypothetical protein
LGWSAEFLEQSHINARVVVEECRGPNIHAPFQKYSIGFSNMNACGGIQIHGDSWKCT